jgi:hypothetical protein
VAETADLKALAKRVFQRDTTRDRDRDRVSRQGETEGETPRQSSRLNPAVSGVSPVSGVSHICAQPATAYREPSVGPTGCTVEIVELPQAQRYRKAFGVLQLRPPDHIPEDRWQQCVADGSRFLAVWGEQAEALNWSSADLFGLPRPPTHPHPSYSRLSRYDCTGLVWLLNGRPVVALTATTATIRNPTTGNVTTYRKHNKPGLGPVGDSLEDLA